MNYWQVMQLPISVFWLFNRMLVRILAEKDLRALELAGSVQGGDGYKKLNNRLVIEMGNVGTVAPKKAEAPAEERDEAGFEALRNMVM